MKLPGNAAGGVEVVEYWHSVASDAGQQVHTAGFGETTAAQAMGSGTVHVLAPWLVNIQGRCRTVATVDPIES
ncbi:hypothetical protein D3C84_1179670 [compost metagenome]